MTNKEKVLLILSIFLSVVVWGFLYGIVAGAAFTLSLLFHEYGHYYWMGREGIKDKTMVMTPPFGAIATTRETWPSLGAEARIALAGPGFGFISAGALLLLGVTSGNYDIKIATAAVCLVNLFNFWIPIAVLDGGRVAKSLLLSLSTKLGVGFYFFSFCALPFLVLKYFSIFTVIIGFLIFRMLEDDLLLTRRTIATDKLTKMSKREVTLSVFWFLAISAGLYTIMTVNGIWYADLIKFITSK